VTAAMVLAAGMGTRLRPLTDCLPKPLVPLGDRALIDHVTGDLRAAGFSRIVANAFHCADKLEAWGLAANVIVSREESLLGTAGGVARARAHFGDDDVLVYNGDIVAHLDLAALSAALRGVAVLAVTPRPRGEGNVGVDIAGRVVRLRTVRVAEEHEGGFFTGIHTLSRQLVAALPSEGCLVGDVYIPALLRGEMITAFASRQPFTDLGTPDTYLSANLAWLGDRSAFRGEHASVAPSVRLKRSVVGQGASVAGVGDLVDCVVWPGASAHAPLRRCIVTPRDVVRVA